MQVVPHNSDPIKPTAIAVCFLKLGFTNFFSLISCFYVNTLGLRIIVGWVVARSPQGYEVKPNKCPKMLGYPALSPFGSTFLKRHLLLSRGDAARTSRGTARAQWLPNLRKFIFLALNPSVLVSTLLKSLDKLQNILLVII